MWVFLFSMIMCSVGGVLILFINYSLCIWFLFIGCLC